MCLSLITEKIAKPTKDEVWVWKVFRVHKGKVVPALFGLDGNRRYASAIANDPLPVDTWLKAKKTQVWAGDIGGIRGKDYLSGFHGSKTLAGAQGFKRDCFPDSQDFICIPIKFRRVRIVGKQQGVKRNGRFKTHSYSACVADEMLLPKARVEQALKEWESRIDDAAWRAA